MGIKIKTYRNVFGSIDNEGNLLPNNNVLYGPYESIDEAYDTIYNALGDNIPIGLTIGIKVDNKITEYWFNKGINKYNLVAKNKTSSNENIDIEDIKTDININKNNIILLDKNIEALASSTQQIIDGRTVVAKAKEATNAEKDSEGNVIKTTYAKQEDYNYTLGTSLTASELKGYFNISHNYNKILAIPYATENKAGVMSSEDKKIIVENKNNITTLSAEVENLVAGYDAEMQAINDKFDELEQSIIKNKDNIAEVKETTNVNIVNINKNIENLSEDIAVEILKLQGQNDDNALAIESKQDILVSGENIKTINGQSIVGYGNITTNGDGDSVDVETNTYVKYVAQTLTEEQQKQARLNIGLNEISNINYDLNVKAINHRGYSYESPENTIPAYIMSKAKGFTYVEGDVAFTKDNVAVLLHDNTIDRTSNGSGKITDFNYQELLTYDFGSWFSSEYEGVKIPTFKEWILLCKNLGLHPYIELKSSGSYTQAQITQVVNEVAACGMKGKVTYISFNNTFLGYVKNADSSARLGFLTSTLASGNITTAKNLKTTANEVFLDAKLATLKDSVVESCISNNIPLEVWTVNTEEEIIKMHSYISGVTSDYLVAGRTLYNNALIYVPPVSTWVPTTSISLDKTTLVLTSFDTANLIAIVEPSNSSEEVVWKSSNTEIATVDNGVVTPITDGSCTITATSGDYSASCATTVAFIKFNITSNLTGCQLDNSINNVIIGTSWSGEVIPNEGYSLKNASIGITMGGVDITNTAYNNGIITIEKVTGDVVVNIVCVAVPVYNITRNLVGCTSNKDIISIGEGNPYNEVFTALDDYRLNGASVTITMGGVDISSMYSNGVLNIAEVTGDIVINITAVSIPVYSIVRSLTNCVSNKDVISIKEGESYTETLTANDGYTLRGANVVITMNDVNITSTSYSNGVLNIDSVTGNIVINVEAVEFKELVPVVDLDLVNVGTDGVIKNQGTGGSTYDTTIQTTSSSDKFSVTAGTGLTLNNHAYANIPYVLKNTDNFTIICKAKIVTKSSQTYQRFFRTDTDAPSWYYSKPNTKLQAKLTGKNSSESTISILGSLVSAITGTNNSGNSVIFNTNTTAICEVMFTCDGTDIKLYINGHASASQPASSLTETTYIGIGDNNPSTKYYASVLEISRFTIYDSVIVSSVIDGPPVNIRLTSNDLYQGAISAKNESVGTATLISPYRTNMTTRASTAADLSILVNGGTTVSIEAKDINGTAMQIGIQSFGDDALDALTNGESLYPYIIDSGWIASGGSYEIPTTHKYAWIVVSYSNTSTNVNVSNINYIQITETNI